MVQFLKAVHSHVLYRITSWKELFTEPKLYHKNFMLCFSEQILAVHLRRLHLKLLRFKQLFLPKNALKSYDLQVTKHFEKIGSFTIEN